MSIQSLSPTKTRLHRIVHFQIVDDYTIQILFDDGKEQVINFEPILNGPVFMPLRDLDLFNQVSLNSDFGALEWPNGADIAPNVLHDWTTNVPDIIKRHEALGFLTASS
ncbi:MAG: DUF2442 domain-containing protein [Anaerolineae bacterium]